MNRKYWKEFNLVAVKTGLQEKDAAKAGFQPKAVTLTLWDHKAYYPGARKTHICLTGDFQTGLMLGAQLVRIYNLKLTPLSN